jgi:hypothetical protein
MREQGSRSIRPDRQGQTSRRERHLPDAGGYAHQASQPLRQCARAQLRQKRTVVAGPRRSHQPLGSLHSSDCIAHPWPVRGEQSCDRGNALPFSSNSPATTQPAQQARVHASPAVKKRFIGIPVAVPVRLNKRPPESIGIANFLMKIMAEAGDPAGRPVTSAISRSARHEARLGHAVLTQPPGLVTLLFHSRRVQAWLAKPRRAPATPSGR